MNTEWLEEARRRFGDREDVFEYVDTPYSLWSNLRGSCQQPRGETAEDDLLTCVAVCFYEHIPEVEAAVKDLPRWFKLSEIMTMREIFSYQVGDAGFERMLEAYPKAQRTKINKKEPTSRGRQPRQRR